MSENKYFINDMKLIKPIILRFFRSTITHGEILSIKFPENIPAGAYIFKAKDLPSNEFKISNYTVPLLYENEINFKGEPIFLLAAENEQDLNYLENNIKVEYKPDAPYTFTQPFNAEQIISPKEYEFINENIKSVPKDTYTIETQTKGDYFKPEFPDPIGVLAEYNNGIMEIQTPTGYPFNVQKTVASYLGIDKQLVRVLVTEMSSPFQGRLWYPSYMAVFAAFIAFKTGRAVKFIYSPEEVTKYLPAQYPFIINHKTTLEKFTDKILECFIEIYIDTGAYPIFTRELIKIILSDAMGKYKIPKIKISEKLIKTHTVPKTFITGLTFSSALSSVENHINTIISHIGANPDEWKKEHLKEDFPISTIDRVLEDSDFLRKYTSYEILSAANEKNYIDKSYKRGIGLAVSYYNINRETEDFKDNTISCTLRWDADRRITLTTATVPQYFEEYQFWTEYISEKLGVNKENIFIADHNTLTCKPSSPDLFNNVTIGIIKVIDKACQMIIEKLPKQPLPIEVTAYSYDLQEEELKKSASGAAVVELTLDMNTYKPVIRNIWLSFLCGYVKDQEILKRNIKKQIFNILLWLTEPLDTGYATNWKFVNIPVNIQILHDPSCKDSLTIGDLPFSLIPSAYASAVSQAIGKPMFSYPLTPDKLFEVMDNEI